MENAINPDLQKTYPHPRLLWMIDTVHEKDTSGIAANGVTSTIIRIFGIVSALLAAVLLCSCGEGNEMTVAEFREKAESGINQALSSSNHDLRRYVEDAHKTVTVHSAYVSDFRVITKDGSTNAGAEGNNIRRVELEITTRWDGMIHKNGYTVIGIEIDNISGEWKATQTGIIRTNALINTEDPKFWYEVGAAAALLLL